MIFNEQNAIFELNNIFQINQDCQHTKYTTNDCMLCIRLDSDIKIITTSNIYVINGKNINYFPKNFTFEKHCNTNNVIIFHFNSINYIDTKIRIFQLKNFDTILEKAKIALSIWETKQLGYKLRATAYFYEIIALIGDEINQNSLNEILSNALQYIHTNYRNINFNISVLSKISNVSEVYFRKIFKQQFGITAKQYVEKLKIDYASSLLSSGYYTVKEVAYYSGFSDEKYFSTTFKKYTNIQPSKFNR